MLSVRGGACIAFGATLAVVLSEGFGWFFAVHVKGAYHWQGAGAAQFMIGLGFIPGFLMVCVLVRGGLVGFVNCPVLTMLSGDTVWGCLVHRSERHVA